MFWFAAIFVASLVLSLAIRPRSNQPTPGIGNVDAPTAEEGREIPVLFGTRDIEGPNCVWYGNIVTEAIKKKGGKK